MGHPFSRFSSLMTAAAALVAASGLSMGNAVLQLGGYTSRGHGQGKGPTSRTGNAHAKRCAAKKRNVLRNRMAHR